MKEKIVRFKIGQMLIINILQMCLTPYFLGTSETTCTVLLVDI